MPIDGRSESPPYELHLQTPSLPMLRSPPGIPSAGPIDKFSCLREISFLRMLAQKFNRCRPRHLRGFQVCAILPILGP